jgi:hypothetical protein
MNSEGYSRSKKRQRDVQSHFRGAKCENTVRDFLKKNDIPYWMNVRLRDGPLTLTEYDFIIPGATIECKYDFNSSRIDAIIKQISTQLKFTEKLVLYIYFLNATSDQLKLINFYLPQKIPDHSRVKIITDLDSLLVHKQNYSYVILEQNILYPFITDPKNNGITCYVESINYYKLKLVVENDSTIFNNARLILFDKKTISPCHAMNQQFDGYNDILSMTRNTTIILRQKPSNTKILVSNLEKLKYLFNVFQRMAPIDPIFMSNKFPNAIVKNVSELCVCGAHYIFSNTKFAKKCILNPQITTGDQTHMSEKHYPSKSASESSTESSSESSSESSIESSIESSSESSKESSIESSSESSKESSTESSTESSSESSTESENENKVTSKSN